MSWMISSVKSDSRLLLLLVALESRDCEFKSCALKFLCWTALPVGAKAGTELHLTRDPPLSLSEGGVTRISTLASETVIFWFITGKSKVDDLALSILALVTCPGKRYGWLSSKIGSTVLKLKISDALRSDRTVSVEEHLERWVSARILLGCGTQHLNTFLNFWNKSFHIWRQSLFKSNKQKNAIQAKLGTTTLMRDRTVL